MATYKLIQDIEAEDHILGPLSLRQFIFALISAFLYYLCFIIIVKHVYFLLILIVPPVLFCTFFAVPFGRDQPTEVWALAKLRFLFKPRRRIWDQSGMKELVTITVPKKIERVLTNGLDQSEVQSRLKALANTLDSRGWVVKNVNVNAYAQPDPLLATDSDRLIDISNVPQEVPSYDVQASDDILDEVSNPIAQQFETMITESTQTHRKQLIDELNGIRAGDQAVKNPTRQNDYWFMGQSSPSPVQQTEPQSQSIVSNSAPPVVPTAADIAKESTLTAQLKARNSSDRVSYSHLRTLQPIDNSKPPASNVQPALTPSAPPTDPAILSLANRNDLNVSTLAHEANKSKSGDEPPQGEVVIALH